MQVSHCFESMAIYLKYVFFYKYFDFISIFVF